MRDRSEGGDGGGLGAFVSLGDGVADFLVFLQRAVPTGLDLRVVNEDIGAAAVGGDEAEALLGVEPFDGALCHDCSPAQQAVGDALRVMRTTCSDRLAGPNTH